MRKMDEMELKLSDQSVKYAYVFAMTSLVFYNLFQLAHGEKGDFTSFVIGAAIVIQLGSFEWLKHWADKTDREPSRILVGTIILVAALLTLGLLMLMRHGK